MKGVSFEQPALDAAQRHVVGAARDVSGVVVGAAGSGKTSAVIARVQHLVAEGVDPDAVVVLTPTRAAATALRDRLALAVGVATAGPLARSVAAFAFAVVREAAVRTGDEPPQLLTGPDEDALIRDLLDGDAEDEESAPSRWPAWLTADMRASAGFRAELRAFLAECLTHGISAQALERRARAEDLPVWASVASFVRDYQRVRARMRGAYRDAAGLVREAIGLVAGSPALANVEVILVDDAQELTAGGIELLEACRARGIAVLAFGDPDVGSGSFRGASPENFARLAAQSPLSVLTGAHRGTPAQHDVLASVTARIGAAGVVAHRRIPRADGDASVPGDAVPDESVHTYAVRSGSEEFDTIARLLRERHVHDGVAWRECAVIAHDTRQVTALQRELAAREVPTSGVHGEPLGEQRAVRDLLIVVEAAAVAPDARTPEMVAAVLRAAGLDAVSLRRLRSALRLAAVRDREDDADPLPSGADLLASALAHPLEFETLDTREGRQAARAAHAVARVAAQLADDQLATAHELLWTVWEMSGNERAWAQASAGSGPLAEQARTDLDAVVALFQAAKRHGEREDGTAPIDFIRAVNQSAVAEDRLMARTDIDAVRVLTPAAALGTEFDTVVIAGVQDGVWPNLRVRGSLLETWRLARPADAADAVDRRREVLYDELRLFARAVSRARERVIVTAVDDDDRGPSVLFDLLPPAQPAPRRAEHPLTLRGLVAAHRRTLTSTRHPIEREYAAEQLVVLAHAGVDGAHPDQWYGIRAATASAQDAAAPPREVRVSPSQLSTLEECALNWVIGDLGGATGSTVAGVGTILHAALEHAVAPDEEQLWQHVQARWGELEFEAPWRDRAEQARAREMVRRLTVYLRDFAASGGRLLGAEPHFEVPLGDGSATLSGYIDRVEVTSAGEVVIVDLKTGKSEPQTDAKVAEHPQLAAYQLAFESGAIAGTEGLTAGGAKLLVLRPTAASKEYATPTQPPFDDDARTAFLARLDQAVQAMRAESFLAPFEDHCRDDHTYGLCRIHTIGAVSSS